MLEKVSARRAKIETGGDYDKRRKNKTLLREEM